MVEWKKLEEFAIVQKTKNKKHLTENAYSITQAGLVPTKSFFKEKTHITSSDTSGYYLVEKDWFVYSPSRIDVGSISYLKDEGPVIVSPIDVVFSIDKNICLPAFLLSFFFTYEGRKELLRNREGVEGMGRRNLPFDSIKSMLIPIPSLAEQTRIVGILDTFTASINNLKEQIAQRRKQYEYYRDQLLDLEGKPGVEMKTLGEICVIKGEYGLSVPSKPYDGLRYIRITDITDNGFLNDDAVSADYGDNIKEALKEGDILFARTGATVGKTLIYLDKYGQCLYAGYLIRYRLNELFAMPKYIFHFTHSSTYVKWVKSNLVEGAQPNINAQKYNSLEIPIPSLSEQQRIVGILDTFEASIQNLEAQLKEREKQYEYYRNKLLTFE